MGYDVFTKRRDPNSPRWSQCYELVDELLEERNYLKPLFNAPVKVVMGSEIRTFDHNHKRLGVAARKLDLSLRTYAPTDKFSGRRLEPPYPKEVRDGAAFGLKKVIDYALKHRVKLFIDG